MAKKRRRKYKKSKFKFKLRLNPKIVWTVIFSLFAIVLISGLVYAIYTLDMFKVGEGDIKSNISLSRGIKNEIVGESLFSLDIESISSQLLRKNPGYKKIYVIKKFPSSVIIDAKKRGFFAQIKAKKFYPLDREAIVLSDGSFQAYKGLIPIEVNGQDRTFKKGDAIKDRKLKYVFNLINALQKERLSSLFKIKSINASNLAATHFFIERVAAANQNISNKEIKIIIGDKDFNERVRLLKDVIAKEIKEKIPLVEYIDLRHKKVYVGFRR